MIKLLSKSIIGLIIIFPIIMIILREPNFFFWLFLNLLFDPGGYVANFLGGNVFWRINISDVFIFFIVVCLCSRKVNWRIIYNDEFLLKFLRFLIIYAIYFFVIYGGIVPYLHNDLDYSTFLLKNRGFIYGFIILISVYVFTLQGLDYFYSITLFFAVICLSLYWITLLTGIELIPVVLIERYRDSGMMRLGMGSYGIFDLIFPIALIAYLISRKLKFQLKYKKLLYYAGIMMVLTLLITLGRRTIILIIGTVVIIVFILSYLYRRVKISMFLKILVAAMLAILILNFTLPNYIGYINRIGEDTYMLIKIGKDARGVGDYRVSGTGDLLAVKNAIRNNLWFGNGYTHLYWVAPGYATCPRGDDYAIMADAANEVPIYYLFFGYGLIGAIIIFPLYFFMAKLFFRMSKLIKQNLFTWMENPLTLLFSIYVLLFIVSRFTFSLYNLGSDFSGSLSYLFLGIGFALYFKFRENDKEINTKEIYVK